MAPLLDGAVDHGLDLVFLPHVHGHGERSFPNIANGLDDRLEVLELARAQSDVGASSRELDGDGFAYAGAASGDDRGLPLERKR